MVENMGVIDELIAGQRVVMFRRRMLFSKYQAVLVNGTVEATLPNLANGAKWFRSQGAAKEALFRYIIGTAAIARLEENKARLGLKRKEPTNA